MVRDSIPQDEALKVSTQLTEERLAAVRLLLASSDRQVTRHDILLASAFEVLAGGPMSTDEIVRRVRNEWPGAIVERSVVIAALHAARDSDLVELTTTLTGTERWRLLDNGRLEIDSARDWGRDVVARSNAFLADEARGRFGVVQAADVAAWAQILLDALFAGVSKAFTENPSGVRVVANSLLFPSRFDLDLIRDRITQNCVDEDRREFLHAMAAAALDPSTPFGSELIHSIATGYILYAYLARHDLAEARAAVGGMRGEVAIVDTPILIRLLGSLRSTAPVFDLVGHALTSGVIVVVHEDSFEELGNVLDRLESSGTVELIEGMIDRGDDAEIVRLSGEDVVNSWLDCPGKGQSRHISWDEFRQQVSNLPTTLKAMGVAIEPTPVYAIPDTDLHLKVEEALRARLEHVGNKRGDFNIVHDTRMIVAANGYRTSNPPDDNKMWPGAFIVTPDGQLNATYEQALGQQEFPIALTLAQWAGLLGGCADPVAVETLAKAIASETSYETLLARGASLPIETAIEIGRAMSVGDVRRVDIEAVQLSFTEMVADQPDLLNVTGEDAARVAREVLMKRHQRLESSYGQQRRAMEAETRRAQTEREVTDRTNAQVTAALGADRDSERSGREAAESKLAEQGEANKRLKRAFGVTVVGLLLLGLLIALGWSGAVEGWWLVAGVGAMGAYVGIAADYCLHLDRSGWWTMLALVGAVGFLLLELALGQASADPDSPPPPSTSITQSPRPTTSEPGVPAATTHP